ncbi:hypothetical protein LXL04_024320 [Taraxacum kok-saghyz]
MAWVSWDLIMACKDKGGLDIGSLVSLNLSLILKWKWRVFNDSNMLWVKMIKFMYGEKGGFDNKIRKVVGTSPWSRMVAASKKLHATGVIEENVLQRKVGNGQDICFWKDYWVGDFALVNVFPRLAAFLRDGVTKDQFDNLNGLLEGIRCVEKSDEWSWGIGEYGTYKVAANRRWIDGKVLGSSPIKTRCQTCKREEEDLKHVFVRCEVAVKTKRSTLHDGCRESFQSAKSTTTTHGVLNIVNKKREEERGKRDWTFNGLDLPRTNQEIRFSLSLVPRNQTKLPKTCIQGGVHASFLWPPQLHGAFVERTSLGLISKFLRPM